MPVFTVISCVVVLPPTVGCHSMFWPGWGAILLYTLRHQGRLYRIMQASATIITCVCCASLSCMFSLPYGGLFSLLCAACWLDGISDDVIRMQPCSLLSSAASHAAVLHLCCCTIKQGPLQLACSASDLADQATVHCTASLLGLLVPSTTPLQCISTVVCVCACFHCML
jgi:hypothetical protein